MIYVSFVEIFCTKAIDEFVAAGSTDVEAYRWATLTFFGGVLFTFGLDQVVHALSDRAFTRGQKRAALAAALLKPRGPTKATGGGGTGAGAGTEAGSEGRAGRHGHGGGDPEDPGTQQPTTSRSSPDKSGGTVDQPSSDGSGSTEQLCDVCHPPRATAAVDPVLSPCRRPAEDPDDEPGPSPSHPRGGRGRPGPIVCACHMLTFDPIMPDGAAAAAASRAEAEAAARGDGPSGRHGHMHGLGSPSVSGREPRTLDDEDGDDARDLTAAEQAALSRMGLLTAIALGLHNFPEGLATFVATLADSSTGFAIAVAIALHNIPEGLCVAMPVYYATGSRWRGVFWATVSGLSEPLGGLLGWAVLAGSVSPTTYAVLFASVAGMMVYISLRELLPTALRNDPRDTVVTYSAFLGMAVMAGSLLLFSELG